MQITPPPNHMLQRTRRERRGDNGFARAARSTRAGLRPMAEFLSPFPKRLKSRVPRAGALGLGRRKVRG